jgi:hypothetical protein
LPQKKAAALAMAAPVTAVPAQQLLRREAQRMVRELVVLMTGL